MKLFCILLSAYVLLLSANPCCTDSCIDKSVVKKEVSSKKDKECQGCSPFFSCGSCIGFIVAKRVTHKAQLSAEKPTKHHSDYQHPYLKEVTLSIWQPPQLS